MNSPTITMERQAAIQKLEEYEHAARANPRAMRDIDKGLVAGYRALAKGKRLVDVNEALKVGGLNLAGQPRLAIARAHVEACRWVPSGVNNFNLGHMDTDGGGRFVYHTTNRTFIADDRVLWLVPIGTFGRVRHNVANPSWRALVPLIPLPLRPKFNLSNYFILWEANWHPEPPRDPYLLKPLAGSLMEIVAEWDLTPLEIAAMRGAASGA